MLNSTFYSLSHKSQDYILIVLCLNSTCLYFYFSYRLADHPQLSAEFTKHLKRLPQSLNTSQDRALYRRLIDTYGTHYIHQVRWLILAAECLFDTDAI